MTRLSRPEVLVNFGYNRDPFEGTWMETADQARLKRVLAMSVQSRGMVAVAGDRGIGKTEAVRTALDAMNAKLVMVRPADKERLLISDIEQEMIFALSDEHPRRGKVIRTQQLRRVLGEASRKNEVVLVIEEAHRLHSQTLRSLKTLRELDWMGKTKLFSVVLVGQSNPTNKAGLAEVRLRSDCIQLQGLSSQEAASYVRGTVGAVFAETALFEVLRQPRISNFLDLQHLLITAMGRALAAGREKVEPQDLAGDAAEAPAPGKRGKAAVAGDPQKGSEAVRSVLSRRLGESTPEPLQATG
ncbi:MAG: AAA family ATPase [Desulfuromonadales bacterium]|nr:AAA family ATPase [Desulfuromonadales bacterium]